MPPIVGNKIRFTESYGLYPAGSIGTISEIKGEWVRVTMENGDPVYTLEKWANESFQLINSPELPPIESLLW